MLSCAGGCQRRGGDCGRSRPGSCSEAGSCRSWQACHEQQLQGATLNPALPCFVACRLHQLHADERLMSKEQPLKSRGAWLRPTWALHTTCDEPCCAGLWTSADAAAGKAAAAAGAAGGAAGSPAQPAHPGRPDSLPGALSTWHWLVTCFSKTWHCKAKCKRCWRSSAACSPWRGRRFTGALVSSDLGEWSAASHLSACSARPPPPSKDACLACPPLRHTLSFWQTAASPDQTIGRADVRIPMLAIGSGDTGSTPLCLSSGMCRRIWGPA